MTGTCKTLDINTFNQTKEAVAKDPSLGKGAFKSETAWKDGAQAVTKARSFTIETDEPKPLGGKDAAVDPMELLLASLGSCLTIGWVTQANIRNVDFRKLKITVEAPYDLRGYLDLDENVRPGFPSIEYKVEVDSDADEDVLEEIKTAAEKSSPMFDNISNGAPIKGEISYHKGKAVV